MTVSLLLVEFSLNGGRVRTVEMPEIVGEALCKCSSTLGLDKNSLLGSLTLVAVQDEENWERDDRSDDGEGSEAPGPSTCAKEGSSSGRADERGGDIWRSRERKPECSILQTRGISQEDIQNICHSIESSPVENLSSSVCLDVAASSHHYKA
jgi:hypothetical protein